MARTAWTCSTSSVGRVWTVLLPPPLLRDFTDDCTEPAACEAGGDARRTLRWRWALRPRLRLRLDRRRLLPHFSTLRQAAAALREEQIDAIDVIRHVGGDAGAEEAGAHPAEARRPGRRRRCRSGAALGQDRPGYYRVERLQHGVNFVFVGVVAAGEVQQAGFGAPHPRLVPALVLRRWRRIGVGVGGGVGFRRRLAEQGGEHVHDGMYPWD